MLYIRTTESWNIILIQ